VLIPAPVKTTVSSHSRILAANSFSVIMNRFIEQRRRVRQLRHGLSSGNLSSKAMSAPAAMRTPVIVKPAANAPASPMAPINVGITPPPTRNPKGTENETARLRALGGVIMAMAAKAAGKNQTASSGWKNTAMLSQEPESNPNSRVATPVNDRLIIIVRPAPSLSEAQPPAGRETAHGNGTGR